MRAIALCLLSVLMTGAGCSRQGDDPAILDVRPSRLEQGTTLIVEGQPYRSAQPGGFIEGGAPTFRTDVEKTVVVLEGRFTRGDGRVETRRVEVTGKPVPSAANPLFAERVLVTMTPSLKGQLGRARFEGKLGVRQEDGKAAPVTVWFGDGPAPLRLDLFPPTMRSLSQLLVSLVVDRQVERWLGAELVPVDQGLRVAALVDFGGRTSRAREYGLQVGDILTRAGDRPISSPASLAIAVRQLEKKSRLELGYTRGDRRLDTTVAGRNRPWLVPAAVIQLGVMLVFAVVCLGLAMVTSGMLTWVERRVAGRMQFRVGPNRVGPLGALQWIADGIKLVLKEDIIPDAVDRPLFKLAPYLVFMGLLGTFVVIPFGHTLIVADLNVGLVYLMAITSFVALGLMMAGWSSNNKWSLLGGMRSSAQIISYEIPTGMALMVPVVMAGTLSTHELVARQGGWPWQWFAFDNPLLFICFFIYFISALAEGNRTPFDLPEAESELVAGYNIEYSGWRFAVFFLSEWANLFVIGAVATTVFLGGWQVPGVSLEAHAAHWHWQLLGLGVFFAKAMTLVFVIIWIRWTLPRFRVDQMMDLCWKYFVPWTSGSLIVCALWLWLAPSWLRTGVQVLTFAAGGLGLGVLFFSRVVGNWQKYPEKRYSFNPFI